VCLHSCLLRSRAFEVRVWLRDRYPSCQVRSRAFEVRVWLRDRRVLVTHMFQGKNLLSPKTRESGSCR
jgi:hypothetical protein